MTATRTAAWRRLRATSRASPSSPMRATRASASHGWSGSAKAAATASSMISALSAPATMTFSHAAGSTGGSSRNRKSTCSGTSESVRTRSWTSGAMASNTSAENRSAGHGAASNSQWVLRLTNSSVGRARTYSALTCSSFFMSKKALALVTSSSRNSSMISGMGRISTPSGGPQPSRAR